jgi:hypothetical protein
MAVTAQAAALTEAYRTAQAKNGALVAYVVAQLWLRSIDLNDISGSAAKLVARLIPLLSKQRDESVKLTRKYYPAFRELELGGKDGFELPAPTELNLEALETSLRVTGEVGLKKRIAKIPTGDEISRIVQAGMVKQAMDETSVDISGAATRHVMNGGRDEMQSMLREDKKALGYIRVTDGDPCYFCAMLASRGPVYDDDSFDQSDPRFVGEGEHKVHDHDQCTVEPVYSRSTQWPGKARAAETAWINLSEELGRVPTINDFRRRWEGRA